MAEEKLPDDLATLTAEKIVSIGDDRGKYLSDGRIKTSQIRNFYGVINGIRAEHHKEGRWTQGIERRLILMKPKLAYAVGRNEKIKPFYQFMAQAIDGVTQSQDKEMALRNFFDLVETVVAYHKFYGEKD